MSKYLEAFTELAKQRSDLFMLAGDVIWVELLNEKLVTDSGIELQGSHNQMKGVNADKPVLARILLVGEGFYDDETNEPVPLECNPGDIVMVGRHSVKQISCLGSIMLDSIGIINESHVQQRFFGEAAFQKTVDILKGAL